jgi:sulfatase modifying factor 1
MITRGILKKGALLTLFFFICFTMTAHFNFAKDEDILLKARMLVNNGDFDGAIEELYEVIEKLKPIASQKQDLAEAYYLLARVYKIVQMESECKYNLKMALKIFPDFTIMESEPQLIEMMKQVKAELAKEEQEKARLEKEKQEKEKVIVKPVEKKKIKKKKFPVLLVVAGIAVVGLVFALMGKKKKDSGSPEPQQPTKGSIRVESTPDDADIWLDGSNTGQKTDATLTNIDPGSHTIRLTKENYKNYETTVNVEARIMATVSAALEMEFDISIGIQWIDIPAGQFQMGDNFNIGDANERPVHTVYLDDYKISKYEINFDQYIRFCNDTGRFKPGSEGWGEGNRPVINVSWYDARDFCNWLSEKTGKNISLPTEAQWEKAARGTDQRRYPWGNEAPSCSIVNYINCENMTMPVGSYPAGASFYGVHDMAGNVWEWCSDWFGSDYYSISPSNNPQGPAAGTQRVRRGGAFDCDAWSIRTTYRCDDPPEFSYKLIGFRIVQN